MGFFDKIFNNNSLKNEDTTPFPWKALLSVDQLELIVERSYSKPQIIFKHSTRCGISSMVLRRFESLDVEALTADFYFLDLIQNREVSNCIASHFKVVHESPQLLVIKEGNVLKHASHSQINSVDLSQY